MPNGDSNHSILFVHHAEQLRSPNCHLVYTVPVSLVFNANLGADYDAVDVIPMVKIVESDGTAPCPVGRGALAHLVGRRAATNQVFESDAQVNALVETSGGVVRDLLRLIQFACQDAGARGAARIDERAIGIARRRLSIEYEDQLQEAFLDRLADLARDRYFPLDELSGRLLYHRLVLEYLNGRKWYDLHPLVRNAERLTRSLA